MIFDVVSAVLLGTGGLVCVLGALGVARFPDTMSRLQAATKSQTFGFLLMLAGAAVRVPADIVAALVLVAMFQVLTAPVLGQLAGRVAYRAGHVESSTLYADDLADHDQDAHTDP